jgi:radical SAM-linked protein
LRNVIKKNISEEQIINAALTLYENGWSKLKFYFICGLPTETLEDMDEMAELLNKIKYRAKLLKREKGLNHGFEITCTLSIFVPKPFTPFQWCGQMDLDEVTAHIMYLKEKTKHIKGLKINYHEKFVSQIEAVLTRGDVNLCKYIEALYKKGCYLDAWGEHFDKNVWRETAEECGLSLEELAKQKYLLEEPLPWNFINVGLDKSWLQNEYQEAMKQGCEFNLQKTCEQGCVNCGVCKNLNTKKVLAKPYKASAEAQEVLNIEPIDVTRVHPDANIPVYRYRLKITKKGLLKYFSHLDWQNTFHKVLARTGLRMAYTLGFNPTMKVSMGIALPLFAESEGELVDIEILDNLSTQEVMDTINPKLPDGARVIEVKEVERYATAVDICAHWAEYKITPYFKSDEAELYNFEKIRYDIERVLSSDCVLITKKNKKGLEKTTDFKKSIGSYRFTEDSLFIHLKTGQGSEIPALRADSLMELVDKNRIFNITRLRFLDEKLREL